MQHSPEIPQYELAMEKRSDDGYTPVDTIDGLVDEPLAVAEIVERVQRPQERAEVRDAVPGGKRDGTRCLPAELEPHQPP